MLNDLQWLDSLALSESTEINRQLQNSPAKNRTFVISLNLPERRRLLRNHKHDSNASVLRQLSHLGDHHGT
jgi:hypothetical protein